MISLIKTLSEIKIIGSNSNEIAILLAKKVIDDNELSPMFGNETYDFNGNEVPKELTEYVKKHNQLKFYHNIDNKKYHVSVEYSYHHKIGAILIFEITDNF